jgi:hypothetical protein
MEKLAHYFRGHGKLTADEVVFASQKDQEWKLIAR